MTQEKAVAILIVEDQLITRVGLRMLLEQTPTFSIVGEAADGIEAVEQATNLKPSVVLMDIVLPRMDGIEATSRIKQVSPESKVLMLTSFERDDDVFAALAAGADGYCLKTVTLDNLATAIRAVLDGVAWLDPAIAKRVVQASLGGPSRKTSKAELKLGLSEREADVLRLVVEGASNQEIANQLTISAETVKSHMRRIMEKLKVSDRTQAAVKALREGLLQM